MLPVISSVNVRPSIVRDVEYESSVGKLETEKFSS